MAEFDLVAMEKPDWDEVAKLIYDSTNGWYRSNRGIDIFVNGPSSTRLFCEVYESLDPGCCRIARANGTGAIVGSCFYHPRETHVGLGIMNVHPDAFGMGVARSLLESVCEVADGEGKPIRLVSSAMNLDSFSLYSRAGFVPRQVYQDMVLTIPAEGFSTVNDLGANIRDAEIGDVEAMGDLEDRVSHLRRTKDYRFFIENANGCWHVSVLEIESRIVGWIASIDHPGSRMLGPCVAESERVAIALLHRELEYRRGGTYLFLVPTEATELAKAAYRLGARNCELHLGQVRGAFEQVEGVAMPTFMPETG